MRYLLLFLSLFLSNAFAYSTDCEEKMKELMLAAERINFPGSAQSDLSTFKFRENSNGVEGIGAVYVYNGDTIYKATGHRLPNGGAKDCVIKKLELEILP